jgi:hypothetical protein
MKSFIITAAAVAALAWQTGSARAEAQCVTFESGEILCDDGSYAYYWSPTANEWKVLDRDATYAALGLSTGNGSASNGGGNVTYGSDGSSLTSTGDGCVMFSAPGYSYGSDLSFSSGC